MEVPASKPGPTMRSSETGSRRADSRSNMSSGTHHRNWAWGGGPPIELSSEQLHDRRSIAGC
eukprot:1950974-Lingulodinium_polyedra.AAC.1